MTNEGKNINDAFAQIRSFLKDVGLMLQSADGHMGNERWETKNIVTSQIRSQIHSPDSWLIRHLFRMYRSDEEPEIKYAIAVLLDPTDKANMTAGPVVVASGFQLEPSTSESTFLSDWQAFWWLRDRFPEPPLTGQPIEFDAAAHYTGNVESVKTVRFFCRPLLEITDEKKVFDLLVRPLLNIWDADVISK